MKCAAGRCDAAEEVEGGDIMPGGDRTGPQGTGPKTGKGQGICNSDKGKFQNQGQGKGSGRGQGQGGGSGRGQGQGGGFGRGQGQGKGSGKGRGNR